MKKLAFACLNINLFRDHYRCAKALAHRETGKEKESRTWVKGEKSQNEKETMAPISFKSTVCKENRGKYVFILFFSKEKGGKINNKNCLIYPLLKKKKKKRGIWRVSCGGETPLTCSYVRSTSPEGSEKSNGKKAAVWVFDVPK